MTGRLPRLHGPGSHGPRCARPRWHWPRWHWPSVRGRARADLAALLLVAVVIALTTLLTSAVPPVTDRDADRAVVAAVATAGEAGTVAVTTPVRDEAVTPTRNPRAAALLAQDVALAKLEVPRRLARVLRPPVGSLTSSELQVLGGGPGRYVSLAYVAGPRGVPAVRWVSGRAPRGTAQGAVAVPADRGLWPVQVALSTASARALGVGPGARLRTKDDRGAEARVLVTGVFEALDPDDDAWGVAPRLLDPARGGGSATSRTVAGALVGDDSLPDLRLAVRADDLTSRVTFDPAPEALTWRSTSSLARAVVELEATPSVAGSDRSWDSGLDRVLRVAHDEAAAARSLAAVLVVGSLLAAALVLALGAQLVVRRRALALASARERGAGLAGTAAELLLESVVVTALGAAAGLALTGALVGRPSWAWPVPVLLVGVSAGPVLGVLLASGATGGRRVPANRSARRRLQQARRARRWTGEAAVVLAAAAAVVALAQRGVAGPAGEDGVDVLAVSAPTLALLAGAVLLLRGVPPLSRLALARGRRSRGAVPFLSAATAVAENARLLPFLVVVVTVAELVLGGALVTTVEAGQSAGAWRTVGADARLRAEPSPAVAAAARLAQRSEGVRRVATARVTDGVVASAGPTSEVVRLVVLDAGAYAALLADTPYPAPQLLRLTSSSGDRVPALLSGGAAGLSDGPTVAGVEARVGLRVVGRAPAVLTGSGPVVVVDAAAFGRAGGEAEPGVVWASGPGAGKALAGVATDAGAAEPVLVRSAVLEQRRSNPLVTGLLGVAAAAGALVVLLGALGVVLAVAMGAPSRLASLARLRTLGLDAASVRRVLLGTLVPPVVLAGLGGLALGAGGAAYLVGLLDLALLTGQVGGTRVVVPWWVVLAPAPVLVAVVVVALREATARGRVSLGAALRVGGE